MLSLFASRKKRDISDSIAVNMASSQTTLHNDDIVAHLLAFLLKKEMALLASTSKSFNNALYKVNFTLAHFKEYALAWSQAQLPDNPFAISPSPVKWDTVSMIENSFFKKHTLISRRQFLDENRHILQSDDDFAPNGRFTCAQSCFIGSNLAIGCCIGLPAVGFMGYTWFAVLPMSFPTKFILTITGIGFYYCMIGGGIITTIISLPILGCIHVTNLIGNSIVSRVTDAQLNHVDVELGQVNFSLQDNPHFVDFMNKLIEHRLARLELQNDGPELIEIIGNHNGEDMDDEKEQPLIRMG